MVAGAWLGMLGAGLVMGIAAIGSSVGIGIAGSSCIGAWKKCYKANKPAPALLLVFAGAPLTQTFYGFILGTQIKSAVTANPKNAWLYIGMGLAAGLGMCFSAIAQGQAGAAGADAQAETGKGFANYIMIVGLCETIALFAMVLSMVSL
jgi:V/A-type H+-transporting ATPase subunit K